MKRKINFLLNLLLTTFAVSSCDFLNHKHIDKDNNHICDTCDETISECIDSNNDHLCDICGGVFSEHKDDNNDHICDICETKITNCIDSNNDHMCDTCNEKISECVDLNNDHLCDTCALKISECIDSDNNHLCDICNEKISECVDLNNDHLCDMCETKLSECIDSNNDHLCDICESKISECVDLDKDHKCDICDTKLSDCIDLDNNHLCDICETKLSECIDSNNDHLCDICGVKLSDCIDSDKDHLCDLCNKKISEHIDIDIDGECDICGKKWSSANYSLFLEFLGETLPYFDVEEDFRLIEGSIDRIETKFNGDCREKLKDIFLATGKYIFEEGDYLNAPVIYLDKPLNNNIFYSLEVSVIYNATNKTSFVDAYITNTVLHQFPSEAVSSFLNGKILTSPIYPNDGTQFVFEIYQDGGSCIVSSNGDGTKYLQTLKQNGYYIDETMLDYNAALFDCLTYRAISPDRSLAMEIVIYVVDGELISENYYTIGFMPEEVPNGTEWLIEEKELMTTLVEEVVPYVNADFSFDIEINKECSEYHNYIYCTSYNIDAFPYAVEAFRADSSYEENYFLDGNYYTFTKNKNLYSINVIISCLEGETQITIERMSPTYETWPVDVINDIIGERLDVVPAAIGSSFRVNYEKAHPEIALVKVTGEPQDFADYLKLLKDNGYSIKKESELIDNGCYIALAPNETILMYLTDYTNEVGAPEGYVPFYMVEIQPHLPSGVYDTFPTDLVNENLDMEISYPLPSGSTFTVNYPQGEDVKQIVITVNGGDREAYIRQLNDAGFAYDSSYSFPPLYDAYHKPGDEFVIYLNAPVSNSCFEVEFGIYF